MIMNSSRINKHILPKSEERRPNTYSEEQVVIKICALCVCLVLILDSSFLNQVNALYKQRVSTEDNEKEELIDTIPFPCEYIYIK